MITAIVLAAGLSRRMGNENKLLLPLKGKPVIMHVIDNLIDSKADHILVVASELSHSKLIHIASDRVQVIENKHYQTGKTSSIQAGIRVSNENSHCMICLGDMPLIQSESYDQLINSSKKNPRSLIVPTYQKKQGNPIIFPPTLRRQILEHTDPEGCKSIVQRHESIQVLIPMDDKGILHDIDTPNQFDSIKDLLQ
jgi:molybdenum cofactor cytidylyltransferase